MELLNEGLRAKESQQVPGTLNQWGGAPCPDLGIIGVQAVLVHVADPGL